MCFFSRQNCVSQTIYVILTNPSIHLRHLLALFNHRFLHKELYYLVSKIYGLASQKINFEPRVCTILLMHGVKKKSCIISEMKNLHISVLKLVGFLSGCKKK